MYLYVYTYITICTMWLGRQLLKEEAAATGEAAAVGEAALKGFGGSQGEGEELRGINVLREQQFKDSRRTGAGRVEGRACSR